MAVVRMDCDRITDWESFHSLFAEVFGFPDFYGRNMNAWIDCMSYLDDSEGGMTSFTDRTRRSSHPPTRRGVRFRQSLPRSVFGVDRMRRVRELATVGCWRWGNTRFSVLQASGIEIRSRRDRRD